ncbi:MAG: hypothetical protein LBC61_05495 [Candidatus Peribacteria bacterium]|nr:hypothetical protein [Candidatus Peribacteria bacterium]
MEEWWQEFKEYVLSDKYKFPSRYASTYEKDLNAETQANSKVKFNHALAEQMAEMFAGYKL